MPRKTKRVSGRAVSRGRRAAVRGKHNPRSMKREANPGLPIYTVYINQAKHIPLGSRTLAHLTVARKEAARIGAQWIGELKDSHNKFVAYILPTASFGVDQLGTVLREYRKQEDAAGMDKRMLEWEVRRSRGMNPGASTFTEIGYYDSEGYHVIERLPHGTSDSDAWLRAQRVSRELGHPVQLVGRGAPVTVSAGGVTMHNPVGDSEDRKSSGYLSTILASLNSEGQFYDVMREHHGLSFFLKRHDNGDLTAKVRDMRQVQQGPEVVVPPDQIQDVYHYALHHGTLEGWEPGSGGYTPEDRDLSDLIDEVRGMENLAAGPESHFGAVWQWGHDRAIADRDQGKPPDPWHQWEHGTDWGMRKDLYDRYGKSGYQRIRQAFIGGYVKGYGIDHGPLKRLEMEKPNPAASPEQKDAAWRAGAAFGVRLNEIRESGANEIGHLRDLFWDEANKYPPESFRSFQAGFNTTYQFENPAASPEQYRRNPGFMVIHVWRLSKTSSFLGTDQHGKWTFTLEFGDTDKPGQGTGYAHYWEYTFDTAEQARQFALNNAGSPGFMPGWDEAWRRAKVKVWRHAPPFAGDSLPWTPNPAASPEQYRLAQAVLSGTARSHMPESVAREIVERTPAGLRSEYSRHNPDYRQAPSAFDAGKEFRTSGAYYETGVANARVAKYGFNKWLNEKPKGVVRYSGGKGAKTRLMKEFMEGWAAGKRLESAAYKSISADARAREGNPDLFHVAKYDDRATEMGTAYRYGRSAGDARVDRDEARVRFENESYKKWLHLYADVRMRPQLEAEWRRGYTDTVGERRHNPTGGAAAADDMYSTFHGTGPTETVVVEEEIVHHGDVAGLGDLEELVIVTPRGHKVVLDFTADPPLLCSSSDGKQLLLRGGDMSVDLATIKMNGDEWVKDVMVLGDVLSVTYRTAKTMDSGKTLSYEHKFTDPEGTKGGDRAYPVLTYDTLNNRLEFAGGTSVNLEAGIVG